MLAILGTQRAAAQKPSLQRADSLLETGHVEGARAALAQWQRQTPAAERTPADQAHSIYLAARLTTRADSAEDLYLGVALSHATSRYAPESLLRLGQARLAKGDLKQAQIYLQRLLNDYPRSDYRALGSLWLARVQAAAQDAKGACSTLTPALQMKGVSAETLALLRNEQALTCAARSPVPVATPTSSSARYTVQAGAFRDQNGAHALAHQIEKAGFGNVRLALMPENSLIRVRVGGYESADAARAAADKLKAGGFSALVVGDRQRESMIKN